MNSSGWLRPLGLVAVAAIVLVAASLPRPTPEAGPQFEEDFEPPGEATAQESLWYCGWVNSGATRESRIAVASLFDADVKFTHPDPRLGEPEDVGQLSIDGPGAVVQDVAEVANRGDAPGFVEFSNGPATASAIVTGETALSGDRCVGSAPKLWHIPGLTTREGYELTLRLFNPFPDNAKVEVRASSELGTEALPDLQNIDVVGKTWVDVDLKELIPFLDNLVITVSSDEGTVIPTIIQQRPRDEASWSGTGLSTVWTFATATLGGLTPRLAVWNPNEGPVDIEIDLYTRSSVVTAAFAATIEAGRPANFDLSDQSNGAVGVRVRSLSNDAVAAAVVAEDVIVENPGGDDEPADEEEPRSRIAGTVGAPQQSASWLLPGAGGLVGGETSAWILNTTAEQITVTLQPLGRSSLAADKVSVAPNSFRRVRLPTSSSVGGYRIDAAVPITASWSLQTADAAALFAGIPIGE